MTDGQVSNELATKARAPDGAGSQSGNRIKTVSVLVSIALLAVALLDQLVSPLVANTDSAMYLQCGQLLLEGKVPYVGIFDLNPPLIMYLSTLPVAMAEVLPLHAITCFVICIWLLALASIGECIRLIDRSNAFSGESSSDRSDKNSQWRYFGPMLACLALVTVTVRADYGEREHIFVLSYLPFLLLRRLRWQGKAACRVPALESCLIGVMAGLAICLKPTFILQVAAPEIFWLIKNRTFKPFLTQEVAAAALTGTAYLAHFLFCPQAMQKSFFGFMVPLVAKGYAAFDCHMGPLFSVALSEGHGGILFGAPWFVPALILCAISFAIYLRHRCTFLIPLACWTAGGYATYILEHKDWGYHTIPMLCGSFLMIGIVYGHFTKFEKRDMNCFRSATAGVLLLVFLFFAGYRGLGSIYENTELTTDLEKYAQPSDQVLILAAVPMPAYPLMVQLGLEPGSRYLWLFPLPMLEHWKRTAKSDEEKHYVDEQESRILREVGDDILKNRPKLIAVHTFTISNENPFCPYFFLRKRRFLETYMANYQLVHFSGSGYKLYKLKDAQKTSRR